MGATHRSFRNITLSFRGAERQAPSAIQLALRFSRVLEIYEQEGKHHAEMSTEQRLQDAVSEFNQSPGLQAKHRIEEDRFRAVLNLLSGTSEVSGICLNSLSEYLYCLFEMLPTNVWTRTHPLQNSGVSRGHSEPLGCPQVGSVGL